MDRHYVGKTRENGAQGVIVFRALTVNDVRLELVQFFPRRAEAALIARPQPADFRDGQRVIPDVVREFFRRPHRLPHAGNDVNFYATNLHKALQQGFRSRAEIRCGMDVIVKMLPVIRRENSDFHATIF